MLPKSGIFNLEDGRGSLPLSQEELREKVDRARKKIEASRSPESMEQAANTMKRKAIGAKIDAVLIADDLRAVGHRCAYILREGAFDGMDYVDDTIDAIKHDEDDARGMAAGAAALMLAFAAMLAFSKLLGRRMAR